MSWARLLKAMNDGMPQAIELLKKTEGQPAPGRACRKASSPRTNRASWKASASTPGLCAKNPYVLSVMTTFLKDEAEGERAIEEISRVAYEYFSRLGSGGVLGRLNGRNPVPVLNLRRWATPNRETNGGMRRCQRLPELSAPR
jgi:hypothetical protein